MRNTHRILAVLLLLALIPSALAWGQFGYVGRKAPTGTCPGGGPIFGYDKTNNVLYACAPGLSWVTIPNLSRANTWAATQTFATITTSGQTTTSDTNCITMAAATGSGQVKRCTATEIIAAPTSGTTTDSTANLLPADALIVAVVARVTTAITGGTCSSWAVGDGTTGARFIAADSTLTANETKASTGTAWTTGIASATTGMKQGSAAKVRLTCGTGAAAAGAVEVTVISDQAVAPTS